MTIRPDPTHWGCAMAGTTGIIVDADHDAAAGRNLFGDLFSRFELLQEQVLVDGRLGAFSKTHAGDTADGSHLGNANVAEARFLDAPDPAAIHGNLLALTNAGCREVGGLADDRFDVGTGKNLVISGAGDDRQFKRAAGLANFNGGDGTDWRIFQMHDGNPVLNPFTQRAVGNLMSGNCVSIILGNAIVEAAGNGRDTGLRTRSRLTLAGRDNIENPGVRLSGGAMELIDNAGDTQSDGTGNDRPSGGSGFDVLWGGDGNDRRSSGHAG